MLPGFIPTPCLLLLRVNCTFKLTGSGSDCIKNTHTHTTLLPSSYLIQSNQIQISSYIYSIVKLCLSNDIEKCLLSRCKVTYLESIMQTYLATFCILFLRRKFWNRRNFQTFSELMWQIFNIDIYFSICLLYRLLERTECALPLLTQQLYNAWWL